MCEKCNKLRAKCFMLFPLLEIKNKAMFENKIIEIDKLLDSMMFTTMEKRGLQYSLNKILN